MGAMVIALGIAVLFQFIILRVKWNRGNYADVGVDVTMLTILNIVFGGSILGVVSATAGSVLISLYLIWFPVRLFESELIEEIGKTYSKTKSKRKKRSMTDRIDSLFN